MQLRFSLMIIISHFIAIQQPNTINNHNTKKKQKKKQYVYI